MRGTKRARHGNRGGVAIFAALFAVKMGARVWVTSGEGDKIKRAERELGVCGGVSYRTAAWEKEVMGMLPADRPFLDAVIDGAGGDIVGKAVKLLKVGGVIAQYGMTVAPKMEWVMAAVLRHVELKGTSMGSRRSLGYDGVCEAGEGEAVVSRVVEGGWMGWMGSRGFLRR